MFSTRLPSSLMMMSFMGLSAGCETQNVSDSSTSEAYDYTTDLENHGDVNERDMAYYSALLGLYMEDVGVLSQVMSSCLAQSEAAGHAILFADMDLSLFLGEVPTLDELNGLYPPGIVESRSTMVIDDDLPPPPTPGTNICTTCCSRSWYGNGYYGYYKTSRSPCSSGYSHYIANSCTTSSYCY